MFRDEFRLRHFKLWHPVHREFADSKWLPLPVFVMYRVIILTYNLGWLIYNIYLTGAKLFIYLTNWTYTILVIYFAFATILSCKALYDDLKREQEAASSQKREETPMVEIKTGSGDEDSEEPVMSAREKDVLRFEHKLLWLMHIISATGGLWVTAGYWSVVFKDDPINANNITKHALNSVFMLIDTSLSSIPVRVVHWLYALLYFAVYLIFSVFYWLLGGTNIKGRPYIYSALNYEDFNAKVGGLLVVFLLLVLPLFHLFLFGITKLRDHLHKKYKSI